jgi:hypothetical protein
MIAVGLVGLGRMGIAKVAAALRVAHMTEAP